MSPMLNLLDGFSEQNVWERKKKKNDTNEKMKNKKTRMIDLNAFKIKYYTVVIFVFSFLFSLCRFCSFVFI